MQNKKNLKLFFLYHEEKTYSLFKSSKMRNKLMMICADLILDIQNLADIKEMMISNSELESQLSQKQYNFRNESRRRSIQQMKSQVRKEVRAINQVNEMIQSMPEEMTEVQQWCQAVLDHFQIARSYIFPQEKIIQLFKMVERFPCTLTLKLFYIIIHKVTIKAIQSLFKYDIMSFLLGIISFPEKTINPNQLGDLKFAEIELVRNCILIISEICQMSENARNFIVCSHKGYSCIKKAYIRFGQQLKTEYLTCLFAFTKHKMSYHEQYHKVIKSAIQLYTRTNDQHELRLLGRSLVNALRTEEKWILDLIQNKIEYNLVERSLDILKLLQNSPPSQLLSETYHVVVLFLMCYIEIGTENDFAWDRLFQEWFYILFRNQSVLAFARQGIYFGLGRVVQQMNTSDSDFQIFNSLLSKYNLLKILQNKLYQENGWDSVNELCFLIKSVFQFMKNWNFVRYLLESQNALLETAMQFIINNYYTVYPEALEQLLQGVIILVSDSHGQFPQAQFNAQAALLSRISPYFQKLLSYSISLRNHQMELRRNETLDAYLENLLRIIQHPL